jgi:hypothetical protein
LEVEEFGAWSGGIQVKQADAGGQTVAWGSGGTGVQKVNAVEDLAERSVGVAEHDEADLGLSKTSREGSGRTVGLDDVFEQKPMPAEFADLRFFPAGVQIVVSGDDRDRGDEFQFGDDGGVADVAGVEDVLDAREQPGDPGVETVMGVGDEPKLHERSWGMPDDKE